MADMSQQQQMLLGEDNIVVQEQSEKQDIMSMRMDTEMTEMSQHQVLGEDNILVHQLGETEVPYVELDGWTKSIPVSFPGLNEDIMLAMKKEVFPKLKGNHLPDSWSTVIEQSDQCLTRLGIYARNQYSSLIGTIVVQVIAKMKSQILFLEDKNTPGVKKAFVMANVIITDGSSACLLTCTEEAVLKIFDRIDVGDVLQINKARYRIPSFDRSKSSRRFVRPFQDLMMKLEINLDKYHAQHVSFISMEEHPKWEPKLPKFLFDSLGRDVLWTPSALYQKAEGSCVEETKNSNTTNLSQQQQLVPYEESFISSKLENNTSVFVDVIGVITYVGRLERYEYKTTHDVLIQQQRKATVKQSKAYRWIQLVDKTSKPLSLRLFARKENGILNNIEKLVPGSVIVITYCNMAPLLEHMFEPEDNLICTTWFSMIYLNEEIKTKYFRFMPVPATRHELQKVLGLEAYKAIIQRKDVSWSVGGTLRLPRRIVSDKREEFIKLITYLEEDETYDDDVKPERYIFKRHNVLHPIMKESETCKIYIRGKIMQVFKVLEDNSKIHLPTISINDKDGTKTLKILSMHPVVQGDFNFKKERKVGRDVERVYRTHRSCICSSCLKSQWQSLKFKMPLIEISKSSNGTHETIGEITKAQIENSKPILVPNTEGSPPIDTLKELTRSDQYNFLALTIRDFENSIDYDLRWDSYSLSEMQRKCKEAEGKTVLAFLDIWKPKGSNGTVCDEIFLKDFVILEEEKEHEILMVGDEDRRSDHTIQLSSQ